MTPVRQASLVLLSTVAAATTSSVAQDDYSFDVSEFKEKAFELGGFAELKGEYQPLDKESARYQLLFLDEEQEDVIDRYTASLELEGRYTRDMLNLSFRTHSESSYDYLGHEHDTDIYEGLLALQPTPRFTFEMGKKPHRWGKGYAWNPVAFVERAKDAGDPELSREGFVIAAGDWIRSFDGPLQTVAFTPLIVPTAWGLNEDFGAGGHINPAAKLYLLYRDTDIDLMVLGEGSRTLRYGVDFAKNLAPNFEIHGEYAYITDFNRRVLVPPDGVTTEVEDIQSYLLGLRYRTEQDITMILEYYFNGAGLSEPQMQEYFRRVHKVWETGDESLLADIPQVKEPDKGPFNKPNPMRRYLHFRGIWNEPFDILYFAPALTTIINLQDQSFSFTPEILYTGLNDLELRGRVTVPVGGRLTEYGEKQGEYRAELRIRYFF